jgi:nicotinamide mononucleotide (NMN) deamidase PncC
VLNPHQQLVERIHSAARPLVLAVTGGGSGAISALLEVPGASATVLEAVVPYSAAALEQWLGGRPDHYCSERTARAMAMASFDRARQLADLDPQALRGIGATASLASTRPKRGAHRIHAAWQSAAATIVASCELEKGARTRAEEEHIATQLILHMVAEAAGIAPMASEIKGVAITRREQNAPAAWTELLLGQRSHVAVHDGEAVADEPIAVLFPGAFNPIHAAHQRMAQIAADRLGAPVTFELSITNVDKPPLDFVEMADRLGSLAGRPVLLTRAPRFTEKAQIAPGCTFVVGMDTIARIGDTKYYQGGDTQRDAAINAISDAGCRFLVFGRTVQGTFCGLSDLSIPTSLRRLCTEVTESVFRDDISSTDLRGGQHA